MFKNAIENGGTVRGINAKGQGGNGSVRRLINWLILQKIMVQRDLRILQFMKTEQVKSPFAKFMTDDEMKALIEAMGGENGDLLLFAADKN